MKDRTKKVLKVVIMVIAVLLIFWGFISLAVNTNADHKYSGSEIQFYTAYRDFKVEADKINIQATSSDFFILKNEKGDMVIGVYVEPEPVFGITQDSYFTAKIQNVSGGDWKVINGQKGITVGISGQDQIAVKTFVRVPEATWLVLILATILSFCAMGLISAFWEDFIE